MSKTLVLTTAAFLALSIATAALGRPAHSSGFKSRFLPKHTKILYEQDNGSQTDTVNSQNYTSGIFTSSNDMAADDFVVPAAWIWRVTKVRVGGQSSGNGGPSSETVIFYRDDNGHPGRPLKHGTFARVVGDYENGNITITLPGGGMKLNSGGYWVSVVANMNFDEYGQWFWNTDSEQRGNPAMWENPGLGYGNCPNWGTIETCLGVGPDLMFDLRGIGRHV